jgi:addiction module RelE/StbE family toxin
MESWEIFRTDNFLKDLKKFRKVNELLVELDKKIQRLRHEPRSLGKRLHGELSSSMSTRLYRKYRLIYQVDDIEKRVYLESIDHRKDVY